MGEADTIEPIRIDAELWSHRDLLERIIGRWFHIIDEVPDVEIGWQVKLFHYLMVLAYPLEEELLFQILLKHIGIYVIHMLSWV